MHSDARLLSSCLFFDPPSLPPLSASSPMDTPFPIWLLLPCGTRLRPPLYSLRNALLFCVYILLFAASLFPFVFVSIPTPLLSSSDHYCIVKASQGPHSNQSTHGSSERIARMHRFTHHYDCVASVMKEACSVIKVCTSMSRTRYVHPFLCGSVRPWRRATRAGTCEHRRHSVATPQNGPIPGAIRRPSVWGSDGEAPLTHTRCTETRPGHARHPGRL